MTLYIKDGGKIVPATMHVTDRVDVPVDFMTGDVMMEDEEPFNFKSYGKAKWEYQKGLISGQDFLEKTHADGMTRKDLTDAKGNPDLAIEKAALGSGVSNTGDQLVAVAFASSIFSRVFDSSLVMSNFPLFRMTSYKCSDPYESTAVWDVQTSTPPATLTEDTSAVFDDLDYTAARIGGYVKIDPVLQQENPALTGFINRRGIDDIYDTIDTGVLTAGQTIFTDCWADDWDESTGTIQAATIDANSQPLSVDLLDDAITEIENNGGEPDGVIMSPKSFRSIKRDDDAVELLYTKGYAAGVQPVARLDNGVKIFQSRKITEDSGNKHDAVVFDSRALTFGVYKSVKLNTGYIVENDANVIAVNMRCDYPGLRIPKFTAGIKDILDNDG